MVVNVTFFILCTWEEKWTLYLSVELKTDIMFSCVVCVCVCVCLSHFNTFKVISGLVR